MNKTYNPPDFLKLIELLVPSKLTWEGISYSIDEWRVKSVREVEENRKQNKIVVFNRFASALLEGFRTKGTDYGPRIELMNKYIHDFSDATNTVLEKVLAENNYSLKSRALEVALSAKRIVEAPTFEWERYFQEAESKYKNGYADDAFLKIKGVGRKVRDFALSEFSLCYCAIDRHVADVIQRTGLLLYGYGQPDFGTSPTENYSFLQGLIIRFSEESGWLLGLSNGYSPKEIDAMFWFFGNEKGICKGKPECYRCPIKEICLTFQNWKGTPIKPPSELRRERQEEQRIIRQWIREHPKEAEELRKKSGF